MKTTRAGLRDYGKRLLAATLPSAMEAARSVNHRLMFRRQFRELHRQVRQRVYAGSEVVVKTGPLSGMRYLDEIVWGPITPKWLGSYEAELHPILKEISSVPYQAVIDVGCAEGYYAVGLAVLVPGATVHAHDTDFISRRQTRRLARLNGVQARVVVRGLCRNEDIAACAGARTLLVCDIEGFERMLLDPSACPALVEMDVLVEIHEVVPGVSMKDLIRDRFAPTHEITETATRDREDWIAGICRAGSIPLSLEELRDATDERRGSPQVWLWMRSRQWAVRSSAKAEPNAR